MVFLARPFSLFLRILNHFMFSDNQGVINKAFSHYFLSCGKLIVLFCLVQRLSKCISLFVICSFCSTESSNDKPSDKTWDVVMICSLAAAGVIAALLLCVLAVLVWRRRSRRTRAAEPALNSRPIRIINPSKKNSLNRRNDPGMQEVRFKKLKMLEKEMDDEDDEMDLMMEKCNLKNARHIGFREELLKGK